MDFAFLLGLVSICYLLLYRYRLQNLARVLKDAGKPRDDASRWKGILSGPQLAFIIHLLAVVAFIVLAWTIVALIFR